MENPLIFTTGKHWVVYMKTIAKYLSFIAILFLIEIYLVLPNIEVVQKILNNINIPFHLEYRYIRFIGYAITLYLILELVYVLFYIKSFRWNVFQNRVYHNYGILPWKRYGRAWNREQIYDVVVKEDFFGWLLKYGTIEVIGREGVTSAYRISHIKNAIKLRDTITANFT